MATDAVVSPLTHGDDDGLAAEVLKGEEKASICGNGAVKAIEKQ